MDKNVIKNKNMILLLTACIEPRQFKNEVQRNDVKIRLEDYKNTLKFWLHHKDERIKEIIFAENSGYELTALKTIFENENIYNRKYNLIQKEATIAPDGLHYGYSELELIDYVFEKSQLLTNEDYVIKVTGRLYFPDLSKLISFSIPRYLFVADSRIYNFLGIQNKYILTTLFISRVDFYKNHIFNKRLTMKQLNISFFEKLLIHLLYQKTLNIMLRFPFNLDPIGIGAHTNKNYGSFKSSLKNNIRSVSRKIFPDFWL